MKLFAHFSVNTLSNCYLIGPDDGGDAILVDPTAMDIQLLRLIESNHYDVRWVLITHPSEHHIHAVRTLLRVYDAAIYCGSAKIVELPCTAVGDGAHLSLGGIDVNALDISGYAGDSIAYRIADLLFTGERLSSGRAGSTPNRYALSLLAASARERVFALPDHTLILPAFGPPSTVGIERTTSPLFTALGRGRIAEGGPAGGAAARPPSDAPKAGESPA